MKEITLRQAAALQNEIQGVSDLDLNTSATFDEPDRIEEEHAEALLELQDNWRRKNRLNKVFYSLRKKVGMANERSGINQLLNKERCISAEMKMHDEMTSNFRNRKYTTKQLKEKLVVKIEADRKDWDDRVIVTTDLLTKDEVAMHKKAHASLKKERKLVKEELLEMNISERITLSSEEEQTLIDENLL